MRQKRKIALPKPVNHELQEAVRKRSVWINRLEICKKKLREINSEIELLQFQESVNVLEQVAPAREIQPGFGLDWGIFWRDAPITSLKLYRIKGLGKIRIKRLIAAFKTMGELESWRITKGLGEIPSFGEKAARELEDELLRWLRRFAPEYTLPASADSLPKTPPPVDTSGGYLCLSDE